MTSLPDAFRYPPAGWLRAQLDRVTYRAGWSLRLADDAVDPTRMALIVTVFTPNSRRPGEDGYDDRDVGVIAHRHHLPPPLLDHLAMRLAADREADAVARWLRWVYDRLGDVELHERAEWFRVDDILVADPHAGAGYIAQRWPLDLAAHLAAGMLAVDPKPAQETPDDDAPRLRYADPLPPRQGPQGQTTGRPAPAPPARAGHR